MSRFSVASIVEAIRRVTGGPAPLHEPLFSGNEKAYVTQCIEEGWVSSVGTFVDRFETEIAEYTGARFAIATVNGTSALHSALLLAGVQRDDEVIVPALSFVATANAVAYCGAVPHFVDVSTCTLGLDPQKLADHFREVIKREGGRSINRKTGRRITAIVPMHTFGHPCEIEAICRISGEYDLPIVEDAAESLGSLYGERHTGTFGQLGVISFNGNKIATAGGGGVILTDDAQLAGLAKHLTTTAKVANRWEYFHDRTGYNYRMPNLNAALACAQLEWLPKFLDAKRKLANQYQTELAKLEGVDFVSEPLNCFSNYWLCALRLRERSRDARNEILEASNDAKIMTRPAWTPLHQLPMYRSCPHADLANTESLYDRLINLPSGAALGLHLS